MATAPCESAPCRPRAIRPRTLRPLRAYAPPPPRRCRASPPQTFDVRVRTRRPRVARRPRRNQPRDDVDELRRHWSMVEPSTATRAPPRRNRLRRGRDHSSSPRNGERELDLDAKYAEAVGNREPRPPCAWVQWPGFSRGTRGRRHETNRPRSLSGESTRHLGERFGGQDSCVVYALCARCKVRRCVRKDQCPSAVAVNAASLAGAEAQPRPYGTLAQRGSGARPM
jgi:hypothetical protein